MTSTHLEHLVGGAVLIAGTAIAFALAVAYIAWVAGGRK